MWTHLEGIRLAVRIENYASRHDLHVALTGGLLYKLGPRKDADFIIYRHNTPNSLDTQEDLAQRRAMFETELSLMETVEIVSHYGYLTKATWEGRPFDMMYPELRKPGEEYMNQDVGPVVTTNLVIDDEIAF